MLRALVVLSLILSLSACGTRLNPLNWFGAATEQRIRVDTDGAARDVVLDGRVLVAEITQLSVEPSNSGAIVRATGVTPAQGYFNAELVEVERTETTLVYEFRTAPPIGNATTGLQRIVVGQALSVGRLAGIRSITVVAQNNRQTVNRR